MLTNIKIFLICIEITAFKKMKYVVKIGEILQTLRSDILNFIVIISVPFQETKIETSVLGILSWK